MVKPQNTSLEDFAKSLRNALRTNNITQSDFALEFARIAQIELKSAQQVVNGMIHGDIRRLTDRNVLLFFQVSALFSVFKEDTLEENLTVVENWYEDFCTAKGIDYIPLKDGVEGKAILTLIANRKTIREQEAYIERVLSPIWNVPHLRNLYFTGRQEILIRLHNNFSMKQ